MMSEEKDELNLTAAPQPEDKTSGPRFPELLELQEEIERRIRDNQRFLDRFLDEDFVDEMELAEEEDGEEEL